MRRVIQPIETAWQWIGKVADHWGRIGVVVTAVGFVVIVVTVLSKWFGPLGATTIVVGVAVMVVGGGLFLWGKRLQGQQPKPDQVAAPPPDATPEEPGVSERSARVVPWGAEAPAPNWRSEVTIDGSSPNAVVHLVVRSIDAQELSRPTCKVQDPDGNVYTSEPRFPGAAEPTKGGRWEYWYPGGFPGAPSEVEDGPYVVRWFIGKSPLREAEFEVPKRHSSNARVLDRGKIADDIAEVSDSDAIRFDEGGERIAQPPPEPPAEPGPWMPPVTELEGEPETRHRQVGGRVELQVMKLPSFGVGIMASMSSLVCAVELKGGQVERQVVSPYSESSAFVHYPFDEDVEPEDGEYIVTWTIRSIFAGGIRPAGRDIFRIRDGRLVR